MNCRQRLSFALTLLSLLMLSSCGHTPTTAQDDAALSFLYRYMPLPDSVDYTREFWQQNVDCALRARRELPWGSTVPEREWRHFVLPVRVNNENLDTSRVVFYEALCPRVKGLSMTDAILEVNHWCHEHVTYQPSDERTSSPLATLRSAIGRCGEESTVLVAALRSVCIPARQVYTPRWAHTDDNHAWVEAWADGAWHFLGACEPEPVLDLGWFNAPASRAMLMHTKVFGEYDGPEEVISRNPCYTEINVTSRYAPVVSHEVQVIDGDGHAVADATVEFKIYNYAEFYTVCTRQSDAQGHASLQAGCGQLLAWAHKGDTYGFVLLPSDAADSVTQLALVHRPGERYSLDLHVIPPAGSTQLPEVTAQQRHDNDLRLAYEDSLRNAYVATFADDRDPMLRDARGNWQTLQTFLHDAATPSDALLRQRLLRTLTAKDLRDVTSDVLADALLHADMADSTSDDRLLSPRVLNEQLRPYRAYFEQHITEAVRQAWQAQPSLLLEWVCDSIRLDSLHNPQQLRMTPTGAFRHRCTDATSRDILTVALARTCGIPARIDPVTRRLEVGTNTVIEASHPTVPLQLRYQPLSYLTDPGYYSHFTLSELSHGTAHLLNYPEDGTLSSLQPFRLAPSDYMLTSGTRMADGSVHCHIEVFSLSDGRRQGMTVPLIMPQTAEGLPVIGSFDSESLYNDLQAGQRSLLSATGRGYYIIGLIAPSHEPSNHALRDIAARREQFDQMGIPLVLLFADASQAARFDQSGIPSLPERTYIGTDIDAKIFTAIATTVPTTTSASASALPTFLIADTFNRVVFRTDGYTIGLGDQLIKAIASLK